MSQERWCHQFYIAKSGTNIQIRTGVDQLVKHQSVICEAVIMQSIVRGRILAVIIASLSAACSPANNERADSATTVQHLFVGGQFVDLHAGLTRLLQYGSDPSQAMQIATFSMIWVPVGGSIFDARNGRYWVKFRCKSTYAASNTSPRSLKA